jgi:hypothetical protein
MKKKAQQFIKMPHRDFETMIKPNTIIVDSAYIEPEKVYENGKEIRRSYGTELEIRMPIKPDASGYYYIYSSYDWQLYILDSLEDAVNIFKLAKASVNKACKEYNERSRRRSIKEFKEKEKQLS